MLNTKLDSINNGENIKDELQAYYGDIVVDEEKNNENQLDLLNCDFLEEDIDIDEVYDELIRTKTVKELLMIHNYLSNKIEIFQQDMQKFIYCNYKKLNGFSKLLNLMNTKYADISDKLNQYDNSNNKENLNKIEVNIFSPNAEHLSKYMIYDKFINILNYLKKFDILLEDYFNNEEYKFIIKLYNVWKKPLEKLSDDSKVFESILFECTNIYNKTINNLRNKLLIIIDDKDLITFSIKNTLEVYISLSDEKHYFMNDLIRNINNLFENIINNIITDEIKKLENNQNSNQYHIFCNLCKCIYQNLFIKLKFVLMELNHSEIEPEIPSSIIEYFLEHSFNKIIKLLDHIIVYNKNNSISNNFNFLINGFKYLNQSIEELVNNIIKLNFIKHPLFSDDKCKYLNFKDESNNIIRGKYFDWCKSILNCILNIENLNLNIFDIWDEIFELTLVEVSDLSELFILLRESVLEKYINMNLFNLIINYKELNEVDFDINENLLRKTIKDVFQIIISNSILYIKVVYFENINYKKFNSIENYSLVEEKIIIELSYKFNNYPNKNDQDWIKEQFSLLNYKQKLIYFLHTILLIRYLRKYSLFFFVSTFNKYFYDFKGKDDKEFLNFLNQVTVFDLYELDKSNSKTYQENDYLNDATMQIITILCTRFELLFLNIFVLWNISTVIEEIKSNIDFESSEKIHFNEFIDIVNLKLLMIIRFVNELMLNQYKCNFRRKLATEDLQFPLDNSEKFEILGEWYKNYFILKNFDLDNSKLLDYPFSNWIIQIINGILIEIISILKDFSNEDCFINLVDENKDLYIKSLTKFWNNIKNYIYFDKEINITHFLFCELYNIINQKNENQNI